MRPCQRCKGLTEAKNGTCTFCSRGDRDARKDSDPLYYRRHWLMRTYGLEIERYEEILAAQGGVCAICHQYETRTQYGKRQNLTVDHDHRCCPGAKSCGKCVRGLLCFRCNITLERVEKNLDATKEYLERWSFIS